MARWFSGGVDGVVTICAGAGGGAQVVEFRACERHRAVAAVTRQCGAEVLLRFDHVVHRQSRAWGMAAGTVAWRTFKDAVDMAIRALLWQVRPQQRKTRVGVIEGSGAGLRPQRIARQEKYCKQGQHCSLTQHRFAQMP